MDQLPLDDAWPQLESALASHANLVLVAEPGAGKTTRFPPRLLRSGLIANDKKILVLEPRRLAARASAHRIAVEQNWRLGNEVGYQVRFENKTSRATRLQFLTEGLLARRLLADSELKDVGAVILDEFHERSQHTDLALGLLFELQQLARPDLRIIVMSATLDARQVSTYLDGAPIVAVPGRTHPVAIHHASRPLMLDTGFDFLDRVATLALDVLEGALQREGDVLVFLPGAREIRGVRERIGARAEKAGFTCFELHGSLALEEQDRAIQRSETRKKIVLATNIAETSLTIDGVGTVIDCGLARVARIDQLGFSRLQLSRISLASATQRAGRAGRQGPGLCYRLWSKLDEASMSAFEQPEILRTELTEPLMTLLSQGVTDAGAFTWFEKPPDASLREAERTLSELGFRDPASGQLTADGAEALKLPVASRLARLVLEATRAGRPALGARLAALLSERDIVLRAQDLKGGAHVQSDLLLRLHLLNRDSEQRVAIDRVAAGNARRVAEALEAAANSIRLPASRSTRAGQAPDLSRLNEDDLALRLLLLAFPDRVCKRRRSKEPAARMVGGRGVWLAPFSAVETADLFVALDSSEPPPSAKAALGARADAQITVASIVEREWIEAHFPNSVKKTSLCVFDSETLSVQKQTALAFRDLPLESAHLSRPHGEEAFPILTAAARELWETHFAKPEVLGEVFGRLAFLRAWLPAEDALAFASGEVEAAFLEEACYGETRLSAVLDKALSEIYVRHLPPAAARLLEAEAPERLTVPTGNRIRIEYPEGRAPYLEVRIQEIFGLRSSPKICLQKVPIVFHLLGPNFRPVQVTSDLESFWKNGYPEVRKELRIRYPKHSWPEDPMNAKPEAKGRRSN